MSRRPAAARVFQLDGADRQRAAEAFFECAAYQRNVFAPRQRSTQRRQQRRPCMPPIATAGVKRILLITCRQGAGRHRCAPYRAERTKFDATLRERGHAEFRNECSGSRSPRNMNWVASARASPSSGGRRRGNRIPGWVNVRRSGAKPISPRRLNLELRIGRGSAVHLDRVVVHASRRSLEASENWPCVAG